MEDLARRSLLYDFYSPLLTKKQQEVYDWYYQKDLSLGEIADIQKVSRQAVYDLLKRTEETLNEYESKLNLVKKYRENGRLLRVLKDSLEELAPKLLTGEQEELARVVKNLEDLW